MLPLDMYCPSLKSVVKQRVCNLYGIYFPSIAAVKRHKTGKGCEEAEYDEGSDDGDNYEEEEDRNDHAEVELVDGENQNPTFLQNPTFVEDDDV